MTAALEYASPVDAFRFGEFRRTARSGHRFAGRITAPMAVAGRFHVYGSWSCPASQRLAIIRQLAGLTAVVGFSYVDGLRDARGWAFREATGPDPVNGFTLLREAYEMTELGYDGPVSVPVLWDATTSTILSSSPVGIGLDLATAFGGHGGLAVPAQLPAIERMSQRIASEVESQVGCAVYRPAAADRLRAALARYDALLAEQSHLVGDHLTDADIRLWVQLVRYDAGPNAHHAVGPRLDTFPDLWRWAQRLYALDAFASTTDFDRFAAPKADLPPWG